MTDNQDQSALQFPLLGNQVIEDKKIKKQPGIIQRLFFCWVVDIMKVANETTLEQDMIKELKQSDKTEQIILKFQENFLIYIASPHALAKTLFFTFKCNSLNLIQDQIAICMLLSFFCLVAQMTTPLLINNMIIYVNDPNKETQEGIILISAVLFFRFMNSLSYQHANVAMRKIGYNSISTLQMALMQKCMKISFLSNKQHTTGEVINLMQVDTQRLEYATYQICAIVFMPIQICKRILSQIVVALYLMFYYIGVSFLAGVGVIIIAGLINFIISRFYERYEKLLMEAKDLRVKSTNELFAQIKFIKINAFEQYFIDKVMTLRNNELVVMRKSFLTTCISILSYWITPMFIINAIFTVYISLNQEMTAAGTFTIISLFQILADPLRILPSCINSMIQANISLQRLQKFLLTEELMTQCIQQQEVNYDSQFAINIQNGYFHWASSDKLNDIKDDKVTISDKVESSSKVKVQIQEENSFLEDSFLSDGLNDETITSSVVNKGEKPIVRIQQFKVKKGQFVAIVGDVGCGKSSILQALLGEMLYDQQNQDQKVEINGTIAYVSQQAWIQNATVKENILFGLPFDEKRYQQALKNSCLDQDINILVKGDMTMIGEKGVNLSGGQKARISLARAVYSQSDIYLLDDPISAVDVHVGKFIIHQCLNGYLKDKTRVLVTHALNYCQYTDYIYLMENGEVKEKGTFKQITLTQSFQTIYKKFYKDSEGLQNESVDNIDTILDEHQTILDKKQTSSIKKVKTAQPDEKILDNIDELILAEDRQRGEISGQTYKQFYKLNGGFIFYSFLVVMVSCQSIISVYSNIWLAYWTQQSEDHDGDIDNYFYLKIYSFLSISFAFFAFGRVYATTVQTISFSRKIHNNMLSCLAYAPQCAFFERIPLGRIMNRFTKDQEVLDNEIQWYFSSIMISLGSLITGTYLNVYASSYYVLIPIVLYFVFVFKIQRYYMQAQRELYRLESISKSPILSYFSETVQGITVIRAFNKQHLFLNQHAENLDKNRKIQILQVYTNVWFQMILTLCSFTINITAIVLCVFYSNQNPAFAGLLMTYASSIDSNIQWVIQALGVFESQMISFERCVSYTKIEPERAYQDLVINQVNSLPCVESEKYVKDWPSVGQIEFNKFKVQYRENLPPALQNVSLMIKSKEKVGVVGRTGAGKSTITMSLLRILEAQDGIISIDGVNLSTLSLKQLRESITMIMQDASIFEGTLRSNIDPLNHHSDQEILDVLQQCCLQNLLDQREGLESKISESGLNLSAGEKQLVCIARAVLKRSKVVLIDEATANIDIETEHQIQETIRKQFAECTVITIAHRINTILHCDKILVIDKGEVKEFDTTKDLLEDRSSIFFGIYEEALKESK